MSTLFVLVALLSSPLKKPERPIGSSLLLLSMPLQATSRALPHFTAQSCETSFQLFSALISRFFLIYCCSKEALQRGINSIESTSRFSQLSEQLVGRSLKESFEDTIEDDRSEPPNSFTLFSTLIPIKRQVSFSWLLRFRYQNRFSH